MAGRVVAVTGAFGVASHGQGLETTLAQIIADHLGARLEDIRIIQGDSDGVPGGTHTCATPPYASHRQRKLHARRLARPDQDHSCGSKR